MRNTIDNRRRHDGRDDTDSFGAAPDYMHVGLRAMPVRRATPLVDGGDGDIEGTSDAARDARAAAYERTGEHGWDGLD
jgi:hypothetical protein